jgi:tetratricopeptide (TPR) repeat protein
VFSLALGAGPITLSAEAGQASGSSARATALPFDPAPPSEADALYRRGKFLEAAEIAKRRGTAQSLAFAARATLMHAGYVAKGEDARKELEAGEALARQAVDRDPTVVEGLLELVIALGYLSREEGYMKAHSDGYGKEAAALIEKAVSLAPDMGWAHAAEGGWNAEIVANGGSFLGGLVYGASRKKAIEAFEKAVTLDPGNPTIRIEYAKALIRLQPKHPDLDKVRTELAAALNVPAETATDRIIQSQGRTLMAAIDSAGHTELVALIQTLTPFEN